MDVRRRYLLSWLPVGLTRVMYIGPGSFIEVTKMLPLLTAAEPGHPSFHVVAPSLPGYAWSEGPSNRGFRSKNYADVGPLRE